MEISETEIKHWADTHNCRQKLPILIRRLIRETTPGHPSLRFPGNEAVDLPGLDGEVQNKSGTAWVPEGLSYWEIGCDKDPQAKANSDFGKRTKQTDPSKRQKSHFVFITPRRWPKKNEWLKQRMLEGEWLDVHAYDAIDIETWLEEAPVSTRWLGELLGLADSRLLTPEEWWRRWSSASSPPITKRMVAERRQQESDLLIKNINNQESVISVLADDRQEAIAFVIATLFENDCDDHISRLLIAKSSATNIQSINTHHIIIADIEDGSDGDFGDRSNKTIIRGYPKGIQIQGVQVRLSHVPTWVMIEELMNLGLSEDDARQVAHQSGYSIPVLRRQSSPDPEIRIPKWSHDRVNAKKLMPFALAGAWVDNKSFDDEVILTLLGDFEDLEAAQFCRSLLRYDDAPISKYGEVYITVSQMDAIFAIGPHIDERDLNEFFQLAIEVLGDRDPALDLPEEQRWMANALGKGRRYSGMLLSGLGDALCILSVYGNEICGVNLSHQVSKVVYELLKGPSEEDWLTIRPHLRKLAEASPDTFLSCIETDLRRPEPTIKAIMGVTKGGITGTCLRTELLWSLEMLAWHSEHFSRAAGITLALMQFHLEDNWGNTPLATAESLFSPRIPATTLGISDRLSVLRRLSGQFRNPVFKVCLSLLPRSRFIASENLKPQWRPLIKPVPEATEHDLAIAKEEASRLLMDLSPFDKEELTVLLEIALELHQDDLARLVEEIGKWSNENDDTSKAELLEEHRKLYTIATYQDTYIDEDLQFALDKIHQVLEPKDLKARHRWLFKNNDPDWRSLAEREKNGELSFDERDNLILEARINAINDIKEEYGDSEILPFAMSVQRPDDIARILLLSHPAPTVVAFWVEEALHLKRDNKSDWFIQALIAQADRANILSDTIAILNERDCIKELEPLLRLAELFPSTSSSWPIVNSLGASFKAKYWETVSIYLHNGISPEDASYAIDMLLLAERPRSIFHAAAHSSKKLSAQIWRKVLEQLIAGQELNVSLPQSHYIDDVLELLDNDETISNSVIAKLEFPLASLLCRHGLREHNRILALHREMSAAPAVFIEMLEAIYPQIGEQDRSADDKLSDEQKSQIANLAYDVIEGWRLFPGTDGTKRVDPIAFNKWCQEALRLASNAGFRELAERHLGSLFGSCAQSISAETWLPECVLDFINKPEHVVIRKNFEIGIFNSRGVTTRSPYEGGLQERELAKKYYEKAEKLESTYSHVAVLLRNIAEDYESDARRYDDQAALGEKNRH